MNANDVTDLRKLSHGFDGGSSRSVFQYDG